MQVSAFPITTIIINPLTKQITIFYHTKGKVQLEPFADERFVGRIKNGF
jgi:hypothetical protein